MKIDALSFAIIVLTLGVFFTAVDVQASFQFAQQQLPDFIQQFLAD